MSDSEQAKQRGGRVSRRAVIYGALGLGGLAVASQFVPDLRIRWREPLGELAAFPAPDRASFLDTEQVLAPYLMTAVPLANDIIGDPQAEYYGFMAGGWWRPPNAQTETNARIMEHISTLAWFAANKRDWNPLYRSEILLARIEAAVAYYTSLQLQDGTYPEYEGKPSLAATTFGIVAQADAYEALQQIGALPDAMLQLRRSIERAVRWFMDVQAKHWTPPVRVFNQVTAGLIGAQRALQILPDPPADQNAVYERISYLCAHGQAPAGFLHEPYGVDFGYNFTVTMPDLAWLYAHTGHPEIVPLVRRYMGFMPFAVLPEPGTGGLWHVPALHARNVTTSVSRPAGDLADRGALAKVFLDDVPSIALFLPTREDKAASREEFASAAGPVSELAKPHTSPRTWMYGLLAPQGPARAVREALEKQLPVLTSERFTKLESGSQKDQYLFVRRPSYYAASVFGDWTENDKSTRQLGTVWSPRLGTILVGTNDPDHPEGWETLGPDRAFSTRQSSSTSKYFDSRTSAGDHAINLDEVQDKTGLFAQRTEAVTDPGDYITGWAYWDQGLQFTFITDRAGECIQRIPVLLKEGDTLTFSDGSTFSPGDGDHEIETSTIVLERKGSRVLFDLGATKFRAFVKASGCSMAGGEIHRVGIVFEGELNVNIVFLRGSEPGSLQAEAHRHSNDDVSIRITISTSRARPVSRLKIRGTGVDTEIDVTGTGFRVFERTLTPSRPGTVSLVTTAHLEDGSVFGETEAAIT
ncbi:hypothetical protein [Pseudoclavibacter terrae]|uniref:Uncharacterized protein n=1 Tax=Pseudoclavibacter terrae TaxID=1530195 RepID=A0A7J5B724_9MICO|nr:hypothetical protein [Pseudoclavibacter terrae]KAB1639130.1 hypothetical protein F8O03_01945 [Pseudoclavibacter terrae]